MAAPEAVQRPAVNDDEKQNRIDELETELREAKEVIVQYFTLCVNSLQFIFKNFIDKYEFKRQAISVEYLTPEDSGDPPPIPGYIERILEFDDNRSESEWVPGPPPTEEQVREEIKQLQEMVDHSKLWIFGHEQCKCKHCIVALIKLDGGVSKEDIIDQWNWIMSSDSHRDERTTLFTAIRNGTLPPLPT